MVASVAEKRTLSMIEEESDGKELELYTLCLAIIGEFSSSPLFRRILESPWKHFNYKGL